MSRFADKVAVITGGTSGIGLATARLLEAEGATVVVTGRDPATLEAAGRSLGPGAVQVRADVTAPDDLDRLFDAVGRRFGRVDVLFANAGVARLAPVEQTDAALFDDLMNTNFRGAFLTAQKALPLMASGGSVGFNASYFGRVGVPGTSVLAASKAAVRSLTRTLAAELLPRGVRVNAVSPGAIRTPIYGKLGLPAEAVEAIGRSLQEQIPLKRFGTADEVARVVAFLASDAAAYMTGCDLAVDGGRTQL